MVMLKEGVERWEENEMNYKVWKKKNLVREGGMGLLGSLQGRFRGDLSI